jgi:hypothetical protein
MVATFPAYVLIADIVLPWQCWILGRYLVLHSDVYICHTCCNLQWEQRSFYGIGGMSCSRAHLNKRDGVQLCREQRTAGMAQLRDLYSAFVVSAAAAPSPVLQGIRSSSASTATGPGISGGRATREPCPFLWGASSEVPLACLLTASRQG